MKNNIVHLTVFLGIVAAIAGGALSFANQMTAPVIQANNEAAEKASLLEMYPDADLSDFEVVTDDGIMADHPEVEGIYKYGDNVIFKMSVSGYDGGTVFLVSINPETDTIDNFVAISNGDTKGIGSKILDDDFRESLIGQSASGHLDTISGATYTSTPVITAINEAATYAAEVE